MSQLHACRLLRDSTMFATLSFSQKVLVGRRLKLRVRHIWGRGLDSCHSISSVANPYVHVVVSTIFGRARSFEFILFSRPNTRNRRRHLLGIEHSIPNHTNINNKYNNSNYNNDEVFDFLVVSLVVQQQRGGLCAGPSHAWQSVGGGGLGRSRYRL